MINASVMVPLSVFNINFLSENLLLLFAVMLFTAVVVVKAGGKLGAPSLLLFLLLGMIAGRDVIGLRIGDLHLVESLGHFAMSVILFTAGLETSFREIKPVLKQGIMLSTLGVIITVIITGLFLSLFGIPLLGSLLIAAIMGSTDSASVFSVLKEKKLRLKGNLGPLLELESGSNDPIALTLTVILVQIYSTDGLMEKGFWAMAGSGALMLLLQLGVGLLIGVLVGYGGKWAIEKLQSSNFALTAIMVLSVGFFANGAAKILSGNGLLATYVAAIIIGNNVQLVSRKDVYKFFDGITWLMELVMFMMLGLHAQPSQMGHAILPALGLCLFMILVSRPLSVFLCLLPFKDISVREKAFVSWVGLKGAGPILFAMYAMVHGMPYSEDIFNLVFLLSLFSLLLQGGTLSFVAKKLHLSYEEAPAAETFGMEIPEEMGEMRDHVVTAEDLSGGVTLREQHLPHGIRVMMVRRGDKFLVPHGSMELKEDDHLIIILGESDD